MLTEKLHKALHAVALCVVRIQVGVSVKIITGRNSSVRFRLPLRL